MVAVSPEIPKVHIGIVPCPSPILRSLQVDRPIPVHRSFQRLFSAIQVAPSRVRGAQAREPMGAQERILTQRGAQLRERRGAAGSFKLFDAQVVWPRSGPGVGFSGEAMTVKRHNIYIYFFFHLNLEPEGPHVRVPGVYSSSETPTVFRSTPS